MSKNYTNNDFDLIIEPNKSISKYWSELWVYRELLYFFAWRDISVRYKQTVIGIAWSLIRPLLTMIVFTFVFQKIANLSFKDVPYPIVVFSALLPWQFFSTSISESSNSIINNSNMISKIYFPRLIIPVSTLIVALTDFLLSLSILFILMLIYGFYPSWRILFIPLFLFLTLFSSLGLGLLLSALTVKYRDFRYIIPFIIQFGLYVSPIGFSSEIIPDKWKLLYSLNPMVGVIEGFRWCIYGNKINIYMPGFILSIFFSVIMLIIGIWYFRKEEKRFADII